MLGIPSKQMINALSKHSIAMPNAISYHVHDLNAQIIEQVKHYSIDLKFFSRTLLILKWLIRTMKCSH